MTTGTVKVPPESSRATSLGGVTRGVTIGWFCTTDEAAPEGAASVDSSWGGEHDHVNLASVATKGKRKTRHARWFVLSLWPNVTRMFAQFDSPDNQKHSAPTPPIGTASHAECGTTERLELGRVAAIHDSHPESRLSVPGPTAVVGGLLNEWQLSTSETEAGNGASVSGFRHPRRPAKVAMSSSKQLDMLRPNREPKRHRFLLWGLNPS